MAILSVFFPIFDHSASVSFHIHFFFNASSFLNRLIQGVANTLADVKVQFNDLTQEHQKMVDQFKVNIDNLESVYTNATKSAK